MDHQPAESLDPNPRAPAPDAAPDSDARVLAGIKKAQRKRLLIALAVLTVAGLGGFLLWYSQRSLLPTPSAEKRERLEKNVLNIGELPKHLHSPAAAESLYEYETERLPAAVLDALHQCAGVYATEFRTQLALAPLVNGAFLMEWRSVCTGGHDALAQMVQQPPLEKSRFLYKACDFARLDLLSEEEAARSDAGLLALAYAIYEYLKSKRALQDEEETLLRYLTLDTGSQSSISPAGRPDPGFRPTRDPY